MFASFFDTLESRNPDAPDFSGFVPAQE